ncbi:MULTISPECIES: MarR family winged helix-turn-helix transcriptional regulator [unclassified Streptomyces]|uniref:MarR family winged helix-turn-helix transcriptional regulator n=1 Tax=unclassified Streptomyces TaxID=2593676 RepID=UPI00380D913E
MHLPGDDAAHAEAVEVAKALERLYRMLRRLSQPSELSLTTVATLSTLEQSGPFRLTELAALEGVTQPAMTQVVSRLQESGFAERRADPADGRVVLVHITDAGRAAIARRRALRAERLSELLEHLSAQERLALSEALPAIEALTRLGSPAASPTTRRAAD